MCALRFKSRFSLLMGLLLVIVVTAHAQTMEALRVGEVAPTFDLATATGRLTSREFVGKRAQFWIVEGDKPLAKVDAPLIESAKKAAVGAAPLFFASTPEVMWPAPFQTPRDKSKTLAHALGGSMFVAIDRAGWVRDVEPLPSQEEDPQAFALRFRLESTGDPTPAFAVGKAAPDFSVRDANGIWRRLSGLRGRKNLVLTFFPRCFTGKCKSQLSSLRDSYGGFQLADTEVWAVSVDAAEGEQGQKAFAQSLKLPFAMLPDEGRNICYLFDAAQTPTDLAKRQSVLIDKEGVVRFIDRAVAPETHGEDLLAHLKELGMTP